MRHDRPPVFDPADLEDGDITDVLIATYPGCDSGLHRDEIWGVTMALAMGHRWAGSTRMDCGCVNRLFPQPIDQDVLDEWALAINAGVEVIDEG